MRRLIVVIAALGLLVVVNLNIHSREQLLENGRVVLLELAPVDPRSLMQGDYMALRFAAALDAVPGAVRFRQGQDAALPVDGHLVLAVDERGVGTFRRRDDGSPLAAEEVRLRYRIRNGQAKLATNAYFFEEGHAGDYAKAKYGEFRVAPDGEAILTALRGAELQKLGEGH
jgi:uncharacterized membrane-anchored protein